MEKGYRGTPRGTLFDDGDIRRRPREIEAQGFDASLAQIAIGRYVLTDKPENVSVSLHNYRRRLEDIQNENDAGYNVVPEGFLFASFISPAKFHELVVANHDRRENRGPRRQDRTLRKDLERIREAMEDVRFLDQKQAVIKETEELERQRAEAQDDFDFSNALSELPSFELWGRTTAAVRRNPALIDERTLGLRIVPNEVLTKTNAQVLKIMRNAGFTEGLQGLLSQEMTIEMIHTDQPLSSARSVSSPKMPAPPPFTVLGPLVIEHFK